jgi:D-alanine-D-alanine ligase
VTERNTKANVGVIFGGRNSEHDVSLASAASTVQHLDRARYDVTLIRIAQDGEWAVSKEYAPAGVYSTEDLERLTPTTGVPIAVSVARVLEALTAVDVVMPVLHGPFGEDGTLQGLLELADVPYVGNGVLASAAAMDKDVTKRLLSSAHLPVSASTVLQWPGAVVAQDELDKLGLPLFVKPARAGSSVGVSRVDKWDQLETAIAEARAHDSKVLVEEAVLGREIDVAVLEHPDGSIKTGPALEISVSADRSFFDHKAKYADPGTRFAIPAPLDSETSARLHALALEVFETLGCRGLARVDLFLREDGSLVVNEVNTFPGLTPASQFPRIWQAADLGYAELLDILIATALTSQSARGQLAK